MSIKCTRCGAHSHGNKNKTPCHSCGEIIYRMVDPVRYKTVKRTPLVKKYPTQDDMFEYVIWEQEGKFVCSPNRIFAPDRKPGCPIYGTFYAINQEMADRILERYLAEIIKLPMPKNPKRYYIQGDTREVGPNEEVRHGAPECKHVIYARTQECIKCKGYLHKRIVYGS
jgi:hypothetical protein